MHKDPAKFQLEQGNATPGAMELAKQNLGETYENIMKVIEYYMDMPQEQIQIVSIWIIGTYFHDCFSTYPFLFINAMRGSGKTRLLRLIAHMAKGGNGEVQTGITEAVLFRTKGILVLDECESIASKDKAILREYLNACYKKGGTVKRTKKAKFKGEDEYIVETFHPYKPIALANIFGMDEVLGDRCITFVLEKSNNPAKTKKLEDFEDNPEIEAIKSSLRQSSVVCAVSLRKRTNQTAWNSYINAKYNDTYTLTTYTTYTTQTALTDIERIEESAFFNKIDAIGIDGRNFELLFPLLIVSKYLDWSQFEELLKIGKELMKIKKEDEFAESRDVLVYEFVSKQEGGLQYHALKELCMKFKAFVGEDEWINEKWLGRALKRLNLVLDKRREASGRFVQLNISKANDKARIFRSDDVKE